MLVRSIEPSAVAALALASLTLSGSALAAHASHPTVVELFQSQGCSSCPPANAVLNSVILVQDGPGGAILAAGRI